MASELAKESLAASLLEERVPAHQGGLETPRLRLEKPSARHIKDIYRLVRISGDLHQQTHIPRRYTQEVARQWVTSASKRQGVYVVSRQGSGEVMGVVSIINLNKRARNAEIRFWLGAPYRGHGYITESIVTLTKHIFDTTSINRIYAKVLEGNEKSVAALTRSGFVVEPSHSRKEYHRGKMRPIVILNLLRPSNAL